MLTFQQVQNARPREKAYKLGDEQGLYLYVTPKGTRSWRFKYRYGQKEKRLTFGLFPEVTIAEARQCRDCARLELRRGKDPAEGIERKKRVDILAAGETLETLARQWLTDHEPHWSKANARRVRNRVEKDILSKLGSFPVRDITSDQVLRQLRKIEARGSIETAKRVKGYVLAILKRARDERLVSSDIIVDIECLADALKPNPPASRRPALTTLPELLAFQKAVDRSSADLLTKLASRLVALTLVRVSTLRLATWEEFDGID